ncbi:hypothetical protein V8F33_006029 [Rhypophila sp. PSN 637]
MLLVTAITLACLSLVSAVSYSEDEGGTQFIYYNGSISGSFVHNKNHNIGDDCGENGVYYFTSGKDTSYMHIGVNPPWDENPLYFSLRSTSNAGALSSFTFTSTYFLCFKDGDRCGMFELSPWYYVVARQLNLSAASISTVSGGVPIAKDDTGPFYTVEGDESTWISDGTTENFFTINRPVNYTRSQSVQCVDELEAQWDKDTVFTYALNFTNTTAAASLAVTVPEGTLTVSFLGRRQDNNDSVTAPENSLNVFSPISLANPAEYALPKFTFTDGKGFAWVQDDRGRWDAKSSGVVVKPGLNRLYILVLAFAVAVMPG